MPAAGMRRTTRVFGVVKGADSARVLRSGRRLWPEAGEGKGKRGSEGDDWLKPAKTTATKKGGDGSPRGVAKPKPEAAAVVVGPVGGDVGMGMTEAGKKGRCVSEENGGNCVDRMFGIVYKRKRKRKRLGSESSGLLGNDDDKMFGLHFARKQRREMGEEGEEGEEGESVSRCLLAVVVKPCCGKSDWFSCLLFLVLRYVRRFRVTLEELSAFVLSEPIYGAFASRGIQFLQGPPTANTGICQFFGITQFMPLFCVDFSAVPLCFAHLHSAMLLKSMLRSFFLVNNPVNVHNDVEDVDDVDVEIDFPEFLNELNSCDSFKREPSESGIVTPDIIEMNDSSSLHSSVKGSRLAGRNGQYRNIVNSRGIQRRRSSLRNRKTRNPSMASLRRSNGALASDLMDGRKSNIPLSGVASSKKLRSLANSCTIGSFKEASSAVVDSSLCSANILVAESDKCYRVEGAIVTLEMSASREWLLTVKKDGSTRCTLKAEKAIRPCSSNRFTHVIMFSLDNGWKLEFANRQDWIVFKDLYKECSERNVPAPVAKFIPVPGVREVSAYADSNCFPFHRPDTYISANGDELSRAMKRGTANYDMDSEDEEWLSKFNNEFQEHVSEDNFELIIDALEKAYYCNPDDCFEEKSAANGCQDLGSKEVVEAVYNYWMRKRKQKRSLLLRVFQGHQSKRAPLIPKPFLRKRRSFKRQPSQFGRGNQPSVLKAIAAEQDAFEENAMLRIEAAKASANTSMELAIQKRKRAQFLSENADLATYKATMLIRIAEAAQAADSVDAMAGYFLD